MTRASVWMDHKDGIRSIYSWPYWMSQDIEGCHLWRECVRWLVDVGVLRSDHILALPQATVQQFASVVRDGILLCSLMKEIVPNAIDEKEIPKSHQLSEFASQKIICLFLGACKRSPLNLKDSDLFEAWELFNMTEFGKVLDTLSKLSHSEQALQRNIKPFPNYPRPAPRSQIGTIADTSNTSAHQADDEDIYRNLKDDIDTVEMDSSVYDFSPYSYYDEENNKIYDHIVARQDSKREYKTDIWSKFQPKCKREHCIKELLDTEQNYVEKALNMIVNKFHAPLNNVMKDHADHATIFMNITELWSLHHSFHNDLKHAVYRTLNLTTANEGRPMSLVSNIGDVFIMNKDKFIIYAQYCMGLEDSRQKILDLEKADSNVKAKILECTVAANDNQFKLQDLLCLPMQRVLKYPILLAELIKHTEVDSPDRESLQRAKEAVEDIAGYVNEMMNDNLHQKLISDVEKSITDLTMQDKRTLHDYGHLVIDCEVRLSESSDSTTGKMKTRHVFIFDKVLIICQAKRGNTYSYKGAYILHELSIDHTGGHADNKFGTITKKIASAGQHLLHLVRESREEQMCPNIDPIKYITFSFKGEAQLEKWKTHFLTAKDNVNPQAANGTGHRAYYQDFPVNEAHSCGVCKRLLKGLRFQGYKCSHCQMVFHKKCIGNIRCTPQRRTPSVTPNASFTARSRPFYGSFSKGDQVMAVFRLAPSDPSYLAFDRDDVIEVLQMVSEGIFKGCLTKDRQRSGLVKADHVKRVRTNSMVNMHTLSNSQDGMSLGGQVIRKESTVLPRRPLPSAVSTPCAAALPDYMNTEVTSQVWYMGNVERAEATKKLEPTPDGTFLVRFSLNRGKYAISISYGGEVKHTIIEQSENGTYYLDEGYVFNSIVELVNYYRHNNLRESFQALDTTLKDPYRECKLFRVIHQFEQNQGKFLKLQKGDVLTLVDTIGEDRGWWKGRIRDQIGFFPMSYVKPMDDSD